VSFKLNSTASSGTLPIPSIPFPLLIISLLTRLHLGPPEPAHANEHFRRHHVSPLSLRTTPSFLTTELQCIRSVPSILPDWIQLDDVWYQSRNNGRCRTYPSIIMACHSTHPEYRATTGRTRRGTSVLHDPRCMAKGDDTSDGQTDHCRTAVAVSSRSLSANRFVS
jgi:hypothetical protein